MAAREGVAHLNSEQPSIAASSGVLQDSRDLGFILLNFL
jgi:hypothetical protein